MPAYATVFMIFVLGSVGLPGTSGFVGEFLTLLGAFKANTLIAAFATTGVVLGAAYMLVLYRRVVFGPQNNDDASRMPDLTHLEKAILVPLIALVFYLGVFPNVVLEKLSPAVTNITVIYDALPSNEVAVQTTIEPGIIKDIAEDITVETP